MPHAIAQCYLPPGRADIPALTPAGLGSRVVSLLMDSGAERPGFKSQPRRCRVTVLVKLFTPISQTSSGKRETRHCQSVTYTNDLHEALLNKNGPTFWKCWRSKFQVASKCTEAEGCVDNNLIADKFVKHFKHIPLAILISIACRHYKMSIPN